MKQIMPVLIIGLLLISACSKGTIDARPIDAKVIEVDINVKEDLCDDVTCDEDSYCVSGECVCNDNLKKCDNVCISKDSCCDSGDCKLGEFCENNKCMKKACAFNQIYDPKQEKCVCDKESNWCAAQDKCIPRSSCCVHSDCGNDRSCSPTYFMTSVCVDDGREKCRSTLEGQNVYFNVNGESYEIVIKSVSSDFVSLLIGGEPLDAHPLNVPYILTENAKLYIESTETAGGVCKDE